MPAKDMNKVKTEKKDVAFEPKGKSKLKKIKCGNVFFILSVFI